VRKLGAHFIETPPQLRITDGAQMTIQGGAAAEAHQLSDLRQRPF
jgi:hypothetical protein